MDITKLDEKSQTKLKEQQAAEAQIRAERQGGVKPDPLRSAVAAVVFFVFLLIANDRTVVYDLVATLFFFAGLVACDYAIYSIRRRRNR